MAWKRHKASTVSSYVLVTVNIIIMVFSTVLFSFGLWTIASPVTLLIAVRTVGNRYLNVLLTEDTVTWPLGFGLAVVSCFAFFIAFMGVYGAISCSQFLLFMYSALVLLLLLLECALIFYFSSEMEEKGVRERDGQFAHMVRLALECCGHNFTSEDGSVVALPWSCCGVNGYPNNCTASQSFKKDCKHIIKEWLDTYRTPIYLGVTAFHVLLASCSLLRRACSASRSHT